MVAGPYRIPQEEGIGWHNGPASALRLNVKPLPICYLCCDQEPSRVLLAPAVNLDSAKG